MTNNTKNGMCSCCGECCGNLLPITKGEIERIKTYLKKHTVTIKPITVFDSVSLSCPFLNSDNRCGIYDIRPQICKTFTCDKSVEEGSKSMIQHLKLCKPIDMRKTFYGKK